MIYHSKIYRTQFFFKTNKIIHKIYQQVNEHIPYKNFSLDMRQLNDEQ
jgi:hypothetical protein